MRRRDRRAAPQQSVDNAVSFFALRPVESLAERVHGITAERDLLSASMRALPRSNAMTVASFPSARGPVQGGGAAIDMEYTEERTQFDVGALGNQSAYGVGVAARCRNVQRRSKVQREDINVRAFIHKDMNASGVAVACREKKRRRTIVVLPIGICPVL